jgi:hypothetical protein
MSAVLPPKLVCLTDWAKITFGEKIPHVNTLRRWVNDGRISPRPQKIGKAWYVKPNAEYKAD